MGKFQRNHKESWLVSVTFQNKLLAGQIFVCWVVVRWCDMAARSFPTM